MITIKDLVEDAREHGRDPGPDALAKGQHLLRSAIIVGATATAARTTKLDAKYHALFTRLNTRWDDYQRYVTGPAVPWDNNSA